ncbi:MAG TPA: Na+/H+ antiporter subunit D [Candidatus Thermoplasmatota archaeon]|nr:Na+/H+ antiporter subunit D [Candidatus Thermoplasmatota archaeon]
MKVLLVLPILIPLLTAAVSLLFLRRPAVQKALGLLGTGALLVTSLVLFRTVQTDGILATQMGDWPAPFGITLVADLLSAIMVVLTGIMGFGTAIYSMKSVDAGRVSFGYYPLLNVLLMGVCGAFLTGDLFNLYVWFEVLLIASFVLLALGGERPQVEGAIKYVALNLVSSALFLAGVGILYGATGTLNMADLSVKLTNLPETGLITTVAVLFLVAFGIKAATFPLFFWLPASYHTPPIAVSAVFAGLLTKVGVYALLRAFTLIFTQDVAFTHTIILVMAGLTMITGVLGAAAQYDFRRILSFHIVSQIGYMIMGLGLYTPLALAGSVFYLLHHIIVKTNLFFVAGVADRLGGSFELRRLGGLYRAYPWLAILFLIPALSLAGIPPLSGFWAKLILLQAGLETGQWVIVAVALVVSLLTVFSMTKIWSEAFWKPAPAGTPLDGTKPAPRARRYALMLIPVVGLAAMTVVIGLLAGPFLDIATASAAQLMDPTAYVEAVLGVSP